MNFLEQLIDKCELTYEGKVYPGHNYKFVKQLVAFCVAETAKEIDKTCPCHNSLKGNASYKCQELINMAEGK